MNPGRSDPGFWCRRSWLRGTDSNRRPSGYEPDELPLLHPATARIAHAFERANPGLETLGLPAGGTRSPRTKVLRGVVRLTGLSGRTTRRTVPNMFRRHRTDPGRELALVVSAFHERLAGSLVTVRTDPPRMRRHDLRGRLTAQAGSGLRSRLERPLRAV
jgi:hypothetical protein